SGTLNDRANVSTASFKAGTDATVTLNPTLYYVHENTSSSTKSHLVAVAPDGNLAASGTIVTMKTIDGQQDVMYAAAVDAGSESAPENSINLAFNHLTTQLSFAMKLTAAATGTGEWSGKSISLKSISIQNVQLPQTVDAADGTVSWTDATSALSIPGISNPVVSTTPAGVGSSVMIKGGNSVKVDVTMTVGGADLTFTNVTIKNGNDDLITETAKAHLITLDVKEPETASDAATVTATATVTPWKEGAAGSADLD
ncbi:fimbrillin family protein, partial [uncultured Bacteroides sp.]|uniref:fimbrillin family protein n=2 Tax=Bacteroides TaxID=816 RepID=UPI0025FD9083